MLRTTAVRVASFLLVFLPVGTLADDVPRPLIRSITIQGNTRTRTEVIRRELIFSAGTSLNPAQLAETERNLRRLLFLGQVDIQVEETTDGVEIIVKVQDLYSRALSPRFSGKIGELSYGLIALDYNFLGRGQTARMTLDHQAISGNSIRLDYQIPRLAGTQEDLATVLEAGSEGHQLEIGLSHPFRTLSHSRSYGLSLYSREEQIRLYLDQILTERYADRLDGGNLWYIHSFGQKVKYRPGLHLGVTDRSFTPSNPFAYTPQDRRRVLPSLSFTLWRPRYARARFIHTLGPLEDIQTGSWLSVRLGISRRDLGSDSDFGFFAAQLSPRFRFTPGGYSFATLYLSGRNTGTDLYNLFTRAELLAYLRMGTAHSLALRLRGDTLHHPEDTSQLLLGLDYGLRGYAPRRFDGTRRLLGNLEFRPTFLHHPFYTLAGALFAEAGTAWTPHRTDPTFNLSLGLGGRLGLPQVYDTPVLRADLAYGWQDRSLQFSFGIGQYF